MSKFVLSREDQAELLQLAGCNVIDQPTEFFNRISQLANRSKWGVKEIQSLNNMIKDGMGFLLQTTFRDKFHHPLYEKYYGKRIFNPPQIGMNELYALSDKIRKGEISSEELVTQYEGQIKSMDEFSELDSERKERLQEEKAQLHNDMTAKTKTQTSFSTHKSKY